MPSRDCVSANVFRMPPGKKNLETVTVDFPGNPPDRNGFGSVPYRFKIGRYEVTAAQYVEFLNAKARTSDEYRLRNNDTEETAGCGITRSGSKGNWTYTVAPEKANLPVNCVSFWDACRFANWIHNGQGDGDTEQGAYNLNGYNGADGRGIRRERGARWFVPSEDEWYKAAYFDPRKPGGPGYWKYPTRNDAPPEARFDGANAANVYRDGYLDPAQLLTQVGAFTRAPGPFGTFDQAGNLFEWNEALIAPPFVRCLRGGCWGSADGGLNERPRKTA